MAAFLGLLALMQWLAWLDVADTVWPTTLAVLTLVYGVVGYGLRRWQREGIWCAAMGGCVGTAVNPGWLGRFFAGSVECASS